MMLIVLMVLVILNLLENEINALEITGMTYVNGNN